MEVKAGAGPVPQGPGRTLQGHTAAREDTDLRTARDCGRAQSPLLAPPHLSSEPRSRTKPLPGTWPAF